MKNIPCLLLLIKLLLIKDCCLFTTASTVQQCIRAQQFRFHVSFVTSILLVTCKPAHNQCKWQLLDKATVILDVWIVSSILTLREHRMRGLKAENTFMTACSLLNVVHDSHLIIWKGDLNDIHEARPFEYAILHSSYKIFGQSFPPYTTVQISGFS